MEKNGFDTNNKKNTGLKFNYFCSYIIWAIFATRKRNGMVKSNDNELRKVRTGLKTVP